MNNENISFELKQEIHFASMVYYANAPKILSKIKPIALEYLEKARQQLPQLNEVFPVYVSEDFGMDERALDFVQFINQSCWNILDSQGYDMSHFGTHIQNLWVQEHHKRSGNEEHVHGFNAQMTGFFIIDAPSNNSSMIAIHDPRPAKKQINLPIKKDQPLNLAHTAAYFKAEPGDVYFMNAWLPHEFTRHASDYPLIFIHFNVTIHPLDQQIQSTTINQPSPIVTEII